MLVEVNSEVQTITVREGSNEVRFDVTYYNSKSYSLMERVGDSLEGLEFDGDNERIEEKIFKAKALVKALQTIQISHP